MTLVGNSFLIEGDASSIEPLIERLREEGIDVRGSGDSYVRNYTSFGADEARELRDRAQTRGLSERRVFIVAAPSMTVEAQNALLKVVEEPPAEALFFLIVPAPALLLPTLRSRTQTLAIAPAGGSAVDVQKFLAASAASRLEMLKPLLEKNDDDKRDLSAILIFLSSLERRLQKRPQALEAVYRARKYAGDKGALVKPLLEQVALLV